MAKIKPAISNFTGGIFDPKLEGRVDMPGYFTGLKKSTNMTCMVQGNSSKRQGTKFLAETKYLVDPVRLMPFEHSDDDTYMLEWGESYTRFYTNGAVVVTSGTTPYEIVSPYSSAQVPDIKFVNSADTTYIVHKSVPPQKLIRNAPTNWTINTTNFDPPPFRDENTSTTTITATATTGVVGLTSTASGTFNILQVGGHVMLTGPDERAGNIDAGDEFIGTVVADNEDEITYTIEGTWVGTITLQRSYDQGATWIDVTGYTENVAYQITNYKDDVYWRIGFKTGDRTSGNADVTIAKVGSYGYVQITDYIDSTTISGIVQKELPSTNATTRWSESSWSPYRGYPQTVTFYEQRLVFGGNEAEPQKLWGSQVDNYENFEVGINNNDSWAYQLASTNINKIKWLVPGEVLYVGTLGAEWKFGSRTIPTTPSYVEAKRQTTWGSDATQALIAGNMVFFVQRGSTILRTMTYDYRNENWQSFDLSKKAEYLLQSGVKTIAYTTRPEAMLWIVNNDGVLVPVTLQVNIDKPIYAFQEYITQGCYDDISVISGADRDEVWVSVKRSIEINGVFTDVYYIEQFQTALWETDIRITLPDTVLPVILAPPGGTYYSSQTVSMSCGTYGSRIYYTLDGSIPTENSLVYLGPIYLETTTTLRARAFSS